MDINNPDFIRYTIPEDYESVERENRRMKSRLKAARLREAAAVEDIDYRHPRGLDKALMLKQDFKR